MLYLEAIHSWFNSHGSRSDPTHDLTGNIVSEGRNPVSGGSHGDIYRGTLNMNGRVMRVALSCRRHSGINSPSIDVGRNQSNKEIYGSGR